MATKVKSYCKHKEFIDAHGEKHTVLVYGELALDNVIGLGGRCQLKALNFGHALCCSSDKFNLETGIKLAKKRFYRDPLMTFNHNFLNEDMVHAIIDNEVEYIIKNIDRYLPEE